MKRSRLAALLVVLMAAILAVTACGKKTPPKETMQNAWAASMEMKSFTFDGSFAIDELALPQSAQEANLPVGAVLQNLSDLSLSVSGAYVQDPLRMEMILKLTIPGDLALTIEVPMIWTEDKMYVRIPNIPMFPLGDAAGKFMVIDPAELAEEEGAGLPLINVELQRKLFGDILNILFQHLNEGDYFQELKKGDVPGLPGDLKADRYVKFSITEDNFDAFAKEYVEQAAPAVIDLLLQSEEYRSVLQLTEEELKRAKEELAANDPESLRQNLEKLKQNLKVNEISMTGAIKDDYLVYQKIRGNVEATKNGETMKIGFSFDIRYDNINKDVTFKHDIPEDALTIEQFRQSLFAGLAF